MILFCESSPLSFPFFLTVQLSYQIKAKESLKKNKKNRGGAELAWVEKCVSGVNSQATACKLRIDIAVLPPPVCPAFEMSAERSTIKAPVHVLTGPWFKERA